MRLTQGDKDAIVRCVVEGALSKREKALRKEQHALAVAVLHHACGKHKQAYLSLPAHLQHRDSQIYATLAGKRVYLSFQTAAHPTVEGAVAIPDGALRDRIEQYMNAEQALANDRSELKAQTRSVVAAANTDKQLAELWPEGKPYYDKVLGDAPRLPVSVKALNQKLAAVAA